MYFFNMARNFKDILLSKKENDIDDAGIDLPTLHMQSVRLPF